MPARAYCRRPCRRQSHSLLRGGAVRRRRGAPSWVKSWSRRRAARWRSAN